MSVSDRRFHSDRTPPLGRYLVNFTFQGFGFNMIIFLMIVGAFHAALYYRDLRARQLREADLEARLARAELNVLRMQLQPHFFFNALHTVSSLMISDVPTAQRVISSLGDLLRSSIDHTARQEIPLREELAFVERYVDVQKARFRDRLDVHVDVPDDLLDALVPSLVLQPLVENAIRHGVEVDKRGGSISIVASRVGASIALTVRDDASDELGDADREGRRPLEHRGPARAALRIVAVVSRDTGGRRMLRGRDVVSISDRMTIRAILVDDEEPARELLRAFLRAWPDVEIAGEAGDGDAAVEIIQRTTPDIVFLDVQMPSMNGFDVVAALDPDGCRSSSSSPRTTSTRCARSKSAPVTIC